MSKLKVIIVGAGLGGLCLAQALRRLDIEVEVFERDKTPWDRPQGYRLHLVRMESMRFTNRSRLSSTSFLMRRP